MRHLLLAVAILGAGSAFAQPAPDEPSLRIFAYSYKAIRGSSETPVEFGVRVEARAPLAIGETPVVTVAAEAAVISQSPEPLAANDLGLVKAVDVLLSAERRIGSFSGAETSLVGLWGFGSALPGENPRDRTLRRYGVGVRVAHPSSGASGRLTWGRDEGVGARGHGQFMFDGIVPLIPDGSLIAGISAALAAGQFVGQDRVLVWLGTDPVALLKRMRK